MNKNRKIAFFILLVGILFFGVSCNQKSTPKPYGYFYIDLPQNSYSLFDIDSFPFRFEQSEYARVKLHNRTNEKYWFDLVYPQLRGSVYFSYKKINQDLPILLRETKDIAYKHKVRADDIVDSFYEDKQRNVYGISYDIIGNTASTFQFVLTDRENHFVRGAVYFDATPNSDSIMPVSEYVKRDMIHLIETFEWKNND